MEALVPKMDHSHRMGGTRDPLVRAGLRLSRRSNGVSTGETHPTGIRSWNRPKGCDRGVVTVGGRGGGMRRLSRGAPPAWYRAPGAQAPTCLHLLPRPRLISRPPPIGVIASDLHGPWEVT